MESITLKIEDQDEITLPDWIGGASLTLAEIGAIACFACLQNGSEVPEVTERLGTEEMAMAMGSLQEKGVMKAQLVGSRVFAQIDLNAVTPPSLR